MAKPKPDAQSQWPVGSFGLRAYPLAWTLGLAAFCACSPCRGLQPKAPSDYAVLPPPVERAEKASFETAPELFRIEAPCSAEEAAEENGLDDNCNGLIDERTLPHNSGAVAPAAHNSLVSVVVAYPHAASGTLRIELDTSESSQDAPPQTDSAGPTVQVRRLDLPALPKGRYPLRLSWEATDPGAPELSLSVSLATAGVSQTYLVRLSAGESRALGQIVFD